MRVYFFLFLLVSTLFLTAGISATAPVQAQTQNNHILEIEGIAWNQTALNILLITPVNQSWWNPDYVNSTLRAIGQWNDAISEFAANYTNYAYLSNVKLEPTVSNQSKPGYAIYLNWTRSTLEGTSDILGLTSPYTDIYSIIVNCTINLSTHDDHGVPINAGDMQNIALHELGHSLGLGHSNYTNDVMYPAYTLLGSARLLSTLDLYGVARVFGWMQQNASDYLPISSWMPPSPTTLPSNITYKYLPVSPQNARPQTLADNPIIETLTLMLGILIHPIVLTLVVLYLAILVIIALYPSKRKKPQPKAQT